MFSLLHSYFPSPAAFHLGTLTVYWYGLILALAALAGYFVATRLARRGGLSPAIVGSIYVNLLFWGVVGARLYHVLNEWSSYWRAPIAIIKIWEGGLAIHGGIIAGAAALFYYARKYKESLAANGGASAFWKLADLFARPLILGQALGRWGNYFNQELFGRPTSLPWGIPIAPPNRPPGFEQYQYFHPTFLYEFLWDILAFVILLALARKKRRTGFVFSWYLIFYGLGRLGTELLRIDSVLLVGGVRLPFLFSVAVVLAGMTMIFWRRGWDLNPR